MDFQITDATLVKKTLAEQIYEMLYQSIIQGKFKPGEELNEHHLAKALNVSRTPIREAFNRLKTHGLVEGNNYSKVTVKKITKEDIEEVFELRSLLEDYAIVKTVENVTDKDIAELETILADCRQAIDTAHFVKVVESNTTFHETLNRISGNRRLIQLLNTFRDILLQHRMFSIQNKDDAQSIYLAHVRILDAIRAKDTAGAVKELKRHMLNSKEMTLASWHKHYAEI